MLRSHRPHTFTSRFARFALAALASNALLGAFGARAQAQSKVWVVDNTPGPGVDFTQVQAAVDAAADGDTILVKRGNWAVHDPVTLDARALTIIGEPGLLGSLPRIAALTIQHLGAGQTCALRALQSGPVQIDACAGPVWLEGLQVYGGAPSLRVHASSSCMLMRCVVTGAHGADLIPGLKSGETGLLCEDANVYAMGCEISGGAGGAGATSLPGGPGGVGLRALGSGTLVLSGGAVRGGAGGLGGNASYCESSGCGPGGDGGVGLGNELSNPQSLILRDTLVKGGSGASGGITWTQGGPFCDPASHCASGAAAADLVGGSPTQFAGTARGLTVAAPIREGQQIQIVLTGVPGDLLLLAFQSATSPFYFQACGGPVLLPLQNLPYLLPGVVGPDGWLYVFLSAPVIGDPSFETFQLFTQAAFLAADGSCNASSGSLFVWLDSAF